LAKKLQKMPVWTADRFLMNLVLPGQLGATTSILHINQ
jgi:hypothetical protein